MKIEKQNMEMMRGSRRPLSSENGAKTEGPVAYPSTYKETPKMPTSVETPNSAATTRVPAEKMLDVKADVKVYQGGLADAYNQS